MRQRRTSLLPGGLLYPPLAGSDPLEIIRYSDGGAPHGHHMSIGFEEDSDALGPSEHATG